MNHKKRHEKETMEKLRQLAQPTDNVDPTTLGGNMIGPGGPHDRGAVVLDMVDCVLLDSMDVCTVDQISEGTNAGQAIYMTLHGRVNRSSRRVTVGYVFYIDGADAMITELLALADRHGQGLLADMTERLVELDTLGNGSVSRMRTALDIAQKRTSE